jgi:D-alanine-D-alanine ligase-like ATP-grasp enzyme
VLRLISSTFTPSGAGSFAALHRFVGDGPMRLEISAQFFEELGADFLAVMRQGENLQLVSPAGALDLFGSILAELFFLCDVADSGRADRRLAITCELASLGVRHDSRDEALTRACVRMAIQILTSRASAAMNRYLVDSVKELVSAQSILKEKPATREILLAAEARGIPWKWNETLGLFQLGLGRKRQWLDLTITGKTSSLGVTIARNKVFANQLLRVEGLPAPRHVPVRDMKGALAAAQEIGFPLVVKPQRGNKGRGVSVRVKNTDELAQAFARARKLSSEILIEELLPGDDHRLLVVAGRLIAAVRRAPARITGDGIRSVEALVAAENQRRAEAAVTIAQQLRFSAEADRNLGLQGMTRNSIPAAGMKVRLSTVANWSQGGTAVDVTNDVHPVNRDLATRVANCIGLDVAGIDFICPDITRPYFEVGGGICEVNYRPGLKVHLAAMNGASSPIGEAIIESVFEKDDGRIPTVLIADQIGSDCVDRISALLSSGEWNFGVVQSKRLVRVVQGKRIEESLPFEIAAARALQDADLDLVIVALRPDEENVPLTIFPAPDFAIHVADSSKAHPAWSAVQQLSGQVIPFTQRKEAAGTSAATALFARLHSSPSSSLGSQTNAAGKRLAKRGVLASNEAISSSTVAAIAAQRGLAVQTLVEWNEMPLMQFGLGKFQTRYRGAKSVRTSHLATAIADDKSLTNYLLRCSGLPCPEQRIARSVEEARTAAAKLNFPVIVKPIGASESRGVTGRIHTAQQLEAAVKRAQRYSKEFLIEKHYSGFDHRFILVDGKVVHVTRHEPASVTGNGVDTVAQLVDVTNRDPRRGPLRSQPYVLLNLDKPAVEVLHEQGLDIDSIPPHGQVVRLANIASLSTGAVALDVTNRVHPDYVWLMERAARQIGLDICGIDFLCSDISLPPQVAGGVILEVNQRPAFDAHDAATDGRNAVRSRIMDMLFNNAKPRALPVAISFDSTSKTSFEACMVLHHILLMSGACVGLVDAAALRSTIGAHQVRGLPPDPQVVARTVLDDRRVETAIILTPRFDGAVERLLHPGYTCIDAPSQHGQRGIEIAASNDPFELARRAATSLGLSEPEIARGLNTLYDGLLRAPCPAQIVRKNGRTIVVGVASSEAKEQLVALSRALSQGGNPTLVFSGDRASLDVIPKDVMFDECFYVEASPPAAKGRRHSRVRPMDKLASALSAGILAARNGSAVLCLVEDPAAALDLIQGQDMSSAGRREKEPSAVIA